MAEQKQNVTKGLPKNIRQIGTSTGSTRIYLEDYVYTYLHIQDEQEEWFHRGFVLLGRMEREKEYTRYIISGLNRLEDMYFKDSIMEFNDDTWAHIYQEMKKYYDNLEIVGWGQDISGASTSLTAEIERSHKQNFNIQKNVLFLMDKVEKEEAFYVFEKNMMQRREGYYVYYEKNPQMQEYMIDSNKNRELDISPDEIKEPLVHSYRETLQDKKAQLAARKWNGVLYTTSMLLVLAVCVLGVSTVNNVEKMQSLENTVSKISGQGDVPAMSQNAQQAEDYDRLKGDGSKTNRDRADQQGDGISDVSSGDINISKEDDKVSDVLGEGGVASGSSDGMQGEQGEGDGSPGVQSESDVVSGAQGEGDAASGDKKHDEIDESENEQDSQEPSNAEGSENSSADSVETSALTEAQTYLLQGYYIVKKGDSLAGISKKIYGTPKKAKKICDLNGIEDMDMIFVGQKLELP